MKKIVIFKFFFSSSVIIQKTIEFSLWDNHTTTWKHISNYSTFFLVLAHSAKGTTEQQQVYLDGCFEAKCDR